MDAAAGDEEALEGLVARRCNGEPLAWLVGSVRFCDELVLVHRDIYVPRWQTEPLARLALAALPATGVAVDLCTGSGAIAVVLARGRPDARVLATDIDPRAVACARANGVDAMVANMSEGLDPYLAGAVDVVTAVVPYVPTGDLQHLPRDVLAYEPRRALDGGPDGTAGLRVAITQAAVLLRPGGSLLLEIGGDQAQVLQPCLEQDGFDNVTVFHDEDGDVRALLARRGRSSTSP